MFVSLCRESARERTEVSTPVHKKDRRRDRVTERDREGKGGQRRWRDSVYVHVYFCVSLDLSLFLARTLSRACTLSLSLPRCLAASLPRCLATSLPRCLAQTSSLVSVLSLPPSPSYSPVSRSVALTLVQSCPRICVLECRAVLIECKTLLKAYTFSYTHSLPCPLTAAECDAYTAATFRGQAGFCQNGFSFGLVRGALII